MSLAKRRRMVWTAASLAILAPSLALMGCAKKDGDAPVAATAGSEATLIAAGKAAFEANGCMRCHAVGGQGGGRGPDLSRVGAKAGRTPQWLVEHIRNPRAHNPRSPMPAFGKISDQELLAIGAYLASLK